MILVKVQGIALTQLVRLTVRVYQAIQEESEDLVKVMCRLTLSLSLLFVLK